MSDARVGADARILERGYRRYTGERLGQGHAVRSVIAHTLRRILGLRRPARSKILPALSIAFAYIPAIVFVGIIALFGRLGGTDQARQIIPAYPDYYGFIISAIVVFVAFVAPEALCPDRRSRVLSLYLASPLTRLTYLAAKAAAIAIVLAAVTVGPLLVLLFGLVLQGAGPDGFVEFLRVLIRILEGGVLFTALFTALSLGIASLTDRRAVAAAATLFVIIGSGIVSGILVAVLDLPTNLVVLNLVRSASELIVRIHGGEGALLRSTPTLVLVLGNLAWIGVFTAIAAFRYRSLQVTR